MRLFSNAVVRTFAPQAASNTPASTASDPSASNSDTPAAAPTSTVDFMQPAPDAILVDGETIVAVGTRAELLADIGLSAQEVARYAVEAIARADEALDQPVSKADSDR